MTPSLASGPNIAVALSSLKTLIEWTVSDGTSTSKVPLPSIFHLATGKRFAQTFTLEQTKSFIFRDFADYLLGNHSGRPLYERGNIINIE